MFYIADVKQTRHTDGFTIVPEGIWVAERRGVRIGLDSFGSFADTHPGGYMDTGAAQKATEDEVFRAIDRSAEPASKHRAIKAANAKTARLAGVSWILMSISGAFAQVFVRGKLIVAGDFAATASNIMSSELLFRFGFICDLLMMLLMMATAVALYKLLGPVNKNWAALMVLLAALGAAIGMLNYLNELVPLRLLGESGYALMIGSSQVQALATLYLQTYEDGYVIAQVFYVLWVLPLGFLVYRSGFLPKLFGVLFICETVFGLAGSFAYFLFPGRSIDVFLLIPGACAEISFMLYLTIRGIGKPKSEKAPSV